MLQCIVCADHHVESPREVPSIGWATNDLPPYTDDSGFAIHVSLSRLLHQCLTWLGPFRQVISVVTTKLSLLSSDVSVNNV